MKDIFPIIIVIVFALILIWFARDSHVDQIKEKVESIGGTLISYEPRFIDHPFSIRLKSDFIYQFKYKFYGEVKEGFVKFSVFDEWKL